MEESSEVRFWNWVYNWVLHDSVFTSKHHFIRPFQKQSAAFLLVIPKHQYFMARVWWQQLGSGTSKKSQAERDPGLEKSSLTLAPRPSGLVSCRSALGCLSHFSCSVSYHVELTPIDCISRHSAKCLISGLGQWESQGCRTKGKAKYFSLWFSARGGVFGSSRASSGVVALTQPLLLHLPSP